MAMHFSSSAIWASIPLGFLVAGILHANNIRDIESDTRHGKRTLATMLGCSGANYELIALDVAAYITMIMGVLDHAIPWIALAVFLTIPLWLDQILNHDARERSEETESRLVPIDRAPTWSSGS